MTRVERDALIQAAAGAVSRRQLERQLTSLLGRGGIGDQTAAACRTALSGLDDGGDWRDTQQKFLADATS